MHDTIHFFQCQYLWENFYRKKRENHLMSQRSHRWRASRSRLGLAKLLEDMIFYMNLYSICIQCTFVRKMEKSKMNLRFIGNWQNTKTLLWRKTSAALRIFLLKSVDKYIFLGYPLYKTSYYNQICNSQIPKR